MDLNRVTSVSQPSSRGGLPRTAEGDAWLAGGTWLFSEPQPGVRRLVDLDGLGWEPLRSGATGLSIAATCPIAVLDGFEAPAEWIAAPLIGQCCRSFLASHKIWNMATVGGNVCLGLPAGPMISLAVALDGVCTIWTPDGGERFLPVIDLVEGPLQNALSAGELLRSIDLPSPALRRRTAFRRISLTPLGRSAALLIGTLAEDGLFALTVTAATRRPVRIVFPGLPSESALSRRLAEVIPTDLYYDDVHGNPEWRRHMTAEFARDILLELDGTVT